jgi:hypothetical protein
MSGDNMAGRELYAISQKFSINHEIYITLLLITMNNMLLDPISSTNYGEKQDKL